MHGQQHVIYGYNAGFVVMVVILHLRVDLLDNIDAPDYLSVLLLGYFTLGVRLIDVGLRSRSFAAGHAACSVSELFDWSSFDW